MWPTLCVLRFARATNHVEILRHITVRYEYKKRENPSVQAAEQTSSRSQLHFSRRALRLEISSKMAHRSATTAVWGMLISMCVAWASAEWPNPFQGYVVPIAPTPHKAVWCSPISWLWLGRARAFISPCGPSARNLARLQTPSVVQRNMPLGHGTRGSAPFSGHCDRICHLLGVTRRVRMHDRSIPLVAGHWYSTRSTQDHEVLSIDN
jgi:hypothetical protein